MEELTPLEIRPIRRTSAEPKPSERNIHQAAFGYSATAATPTITGEPQQPDVTEEDLGQASKSTLRRRLTLWVSVAKEHVAQAGTLPRVHSKSLLMTA